MINNSIFCASFLITPPFEKYIKVWDWSNFPYTSHDLAKLINLIWIHYQKFAKYQRIYGRNISIGNLRSKLPTETFPSVIQSVTTDKNFSVRNSVGNYRRKLSIGSFRLNYGRKSFWIKKKGGSLRGWFWRVIFFPTE